MLVTANIFSQQTNFTETNKSTYNTNFSNLPKIENIEKGSDIGTLFAERKDPFLAGFYSFFMMGAGHFYAGAYQKGTLFLFSDLMLKAVMVGMLLHFKSAYTTDQNDSYQWKDLDVSDRGFIVGYSIVYIFVLVLNITDAVKSAKDYNRRYIRKPGISLNFKIGVEKFGLALNKNF